MVSSFPYSINWSKANIPSILHISQSSQELGNAVGDIIFGKVSPAGRLVQTWITSIDQLPPILDYNIRNGRTYMYSKNEPLFPFGHGLTYTEFSYSDLKTDRKRISPAETVNVSFTIRNTGNYDSDEVPQLYVSFPGSKAERPAKALKGFARVFIKKAESRIITIPLKASDLAYWNTDTGMWTNEPGEVDFFIGSSSSDIKLKGKLILN
jgi:beta-glucosidase